MSPQRSSIAPAWLLAMAVAIAGCAPLPPLDGRTESYALQDTAATPLGQAIAPEAERHPGLTGIEPIADGRVALGMRLAMLRAATRSLDIQTFIWHADNSGTLLYEEVLRAAERGVRVRLLLDDVNMQGLDPIFALLDAQPNIQLRLYNPFTSRGSRGLGFLGDFHRLNRRMHNKSFTVDNQVAIVGGRNIADEYFEAGEGLALRRHRRPRRRRRRCVRSRPSSTSTGTATRRTRRGSSSIASRPSAGPSSRRGRRPSTRARPRAPMSKPWTARPRPRPCSPAS